MNARLVALVLAMAAAGPAWAADPTAEQLAAGFRNPPDTARPLTLWHWMNGCVSKEGITADLESYKRAGLAGTQQFLVGGTEAVLDDPSVSILNDKWRDLFKFAVSESARLNLEFGTHNSPGWSSSAFPTVPVENSMQKLVFGPAATFHGPGHCELKLAPGAALRNYYKDVAVLACNGALPAARDVLDLTSKMTPEGTLTWEAPDGDWTIVRIGHTTTGKINATAPPSGQGLEVDKFSPAALAAYWKTFPQTLIDDAGAHAGKSFKTLEVDSYEAGPQDWTPRMREEFTKRRGYDPLPWLLTLNANRTVESAALTARFKADWSLTIAELFADNYYGALRDLVHRVPGMQLMIEPYNTADRPTFDANNIAGRGDLVTAEFWQKPATWGWDCVNTTASGVHTWGSPGGICAAEAFTGQPQFAWQVDPYALKSTGDRAFCCGVNRLFFHTSAHQPWLDAAPGMTMGWWGTQFGRTQTWWDHGAREWIAYLSRCQYLLQQGRFVADLCYLEYGRITPASPRGYAADAIGTDALLTRMSVKSGRLTLPDGMSYAALVLPNRTTILPSLARKIRQLVQEGAVVIGPKPTSSPSLENYPACDQEVAAIGDQLWGPATPDATAHPFGQGRVFNAVAATPAPAPTDRQGGTEHLPAIMAALSALHLSPDVQLPENLAGPAAFAYASARPIMWIHRQTTDADLYFVSNQQETAVELDVTFRIAAKAPELWDPETAVIQPAMRWRLSGSGADSGTQVHLTLGPSGSTLVVFRKPAAGFDPVSLIERDGQPDATGASILPNSDPRAAVTLAAAAPGTYVATTAAGRKFTAQVNALPEPVALAGPWQLSFPPNRGAPEKVTLDKLLSWSDHPLPGVRYFSGTATYAAAFQMPPASLAPGRRFTLDLGTVRNIAEVKVNDVPLPLLWHPPFRQDITAALHAGDNKLEVALTNLWPNRLIGDEQEPADLAWGTLQTMTINNQRLQIGEPLTTVPEWLAKGTPRPSSQRVTFETFRFFHKNSPLLPSGLLGPVTIRCEQQVPLQP